MRNRIRGTSRVFRRVLFVTDGEIHLLVDGKAIAVNAGGMYIVPPAWCTASRPAAMARSLSSIERT